MEEQQPYQKLDVNGFFGVEIDPFYKTGLKNFAEDFGIENIPDERYMVVPLGLLTEEEEKPVQPIMSGPLIMTEFLLYIDDEADQPNLMVSFESSIAEEKIDDLRKEYDLEEEIDDENPYDLSFVLSYDYQGEDSDEHLNMLSYKFNQYFPVIEASKEVTGYYSDDEIDAMMFGIWPDEELGATS